MPKKSDLPFRTVYNGHKLSQYLTSPLTRVNDLRKLLNQLSPHAWIYGYDLRDAFYSIVVHPVSRHLLLFAFQGQLYRYRTLPMGISPSAAHLCEMTSSLCDYWSQQTVQLELVKMSAYFDDLNGWAPHQQAAAAHSDFVRQEIELLGLHWNRTKSMPSPAQQAVILGYHINTITMVASLPTGKLQRITEVARHFLQYKQATAREILSLTGRLMDGRLASDLFRACAYALYPLLSSTASWDSVVMLSEETLECLRFFSDNSTALNGRRFRYCPADVTILATDSRLSHWAFVILRGPHTGQSQRGPWTEVCLPFSLTEQNINALKLYVLLLALQRFRHQLAGTTLWWHVDNQVALSYIRKCGGPVDYLRRLTWCILQTVQSMGVYLTPPRYIRSHENPADYGTRHQDMDSVRISRHAYDQLNLLWGPFGVDLFADSSNAMCPRFFSATLQEGTSAVDALAQDWSLITQPAWIFPPVELIDAVINKLKLQRPKAGAVLIVPVLKSSLWWPQFMRLSQHTRKLRCQDFKVDGCDMLSIFLSSSEQFMAVRIL